MQLTVSHMKIVTQSQTKLVLREAPHVWPFIGLTIIFGALLLLSNHQFHLICSRINQTAADCIIQEKRVFGLFSTTTTIKDLKIASIDKHCGPKDIGLSKVKLVAGSGSFSFPGNNEDLYEKQKFADGINQALGDSTRKEFAFQLEDKILYRIFFIIGCVVLGILALVGLSAGMLTINFDRNNGVVTIHYIGFYKIRTQKLSLSEVTGANFDFSINRIVLILTNNTRLPIDYRASNPNNFDRVSAVKAIQEFLPKSTGQGRGIDSIS